MFLLSAIDWDFQEALLHRQCKERRIAFSEGPNYKAPAFPECIALKDDGTKCKAHTVPLAKHCIDRILVPAMVSCDGCVQLVLLYM